CEQAARAAGPWPARRDRPRSVCRLRGLRKGSARGFQIGRRDRSHVPEPPRRGARAVAAGVRRVPGGCDHGVRRAGETARSVWIHTLRVGSAKRCPEGQRSSLTAPTWARILAARCTETRVSWRAPPVVTSDIHSRLDADRYRPGGSHRVWREESVCPARAAEGGAGVPRALRPLRQLLACGLG